ncbi:MAG: 2-dehydropantoate 2-reductase [Desulfobacteraceae bacterium]|nr:2-dehydropantoate 2-reductase [Desulfobacteraceae bacterium]
MKIAVIGSGAVGGVIGAQLSGTGLDVNLYDVNRSLIEAVDSDGITLEMPTGQKKTYHAKITDDVASIGMVDLAVICVKGYHTESAIKDSLPVVGENTHVLSIQNGVGNIEIIADTIGDAHRVLGGSLKANVLPHTHTHLLYSPGDGLVLGPMDNEVREVHHDIVTAFGKAGIQAEVTDNIQGALWTKVSHNVMNALAAILWLRNEEYLNYPSAVSIWEKAVKEAAEVAAAQGIVIEDPEDPCASPRKIYEIWREAGSKGETTTMQDLSKGRKTEVEIINGAVVGAGRKYNVPTPVNEVLTLLVKAFEEKKGIRPAGFP